MKKINRKGFTLIELLAVIVIMAIIVVVTVPTIINTISDARVNSIWNLAVATANSYDTMSAQDLISTNKILSGVEASVGTWNCIGALQYTTTDDKGTTDTSDDVTTTTKLADILDLSDTDLVLTAASTNDVPSGDAPTVTSTTCSAIRLKSNGSAEVLLVAKSGGKFAISGKTVYALSSKDNGVQQ